MKLGNFLDSTWQKLGVITGALSLVNGVIIVSRVKAAGNNALPAGAMFLLLFMGVVILPAVINRMLRAVRGVIWEKSPRTIDFGRALRENGLATKFICESNAVSYYFIIDNETGEAISRIAVSSKLGVVLDIQFKLYANINGNIVPGFVNYSLKKSPYICFAAADGLVDDDKDIFIDMGHIEALCGSLNIRPHVRGIGTTSFKLGHEKVDLVKPAL